MKPWRNVIRPRQEVLTGRYSQAEFAADVSQVVNGKAEQNYQDPAIFFDRTCVTEGMGLLLQQVARRMHGSDAEPVIQLQTSFGGGKTHTLIAVYHLVTQKISLSQMSGIGNILTQAGLSHIPAARVCMLDGNSLSPGKANPRPGINTNTLWGELGWQLLGLEGYELLKDNDQNGTSPGKTVLADLLRKASPCVVMFDELVAYIRQLDSRLLSGGTYEANLSFIQALTEAVKQVPQAMILASLPESEIEAGGERGREVLRSLEKIFGRVQSLWKPVTPEESFEIVRRRLFERDYDLNERDQTCNAFMECYRQAATQLPTEVNESERYLNRLKQAYPIHPEVFDRLYEDWSGLESFQKTRGVLKLMARVIYSLMQHDNLHLLIMPATIPLDDNNVRNEFVQFLPNGWDPVITKDIDGPNANTKLVQEEARFGANFAAKRVARTVFLATAPGSAGIRESRNRGIEGSRILLGCLVPSESASVYIDVLSRLTDRLHYWNNSGDPANLATRFWFDTRANLRQEVEFRAQQMPGADVQKAVETELRKLMGSSSHLRNYHIFPNPADVPDDSEIRLVVFKVGQSIVRDTTLQCEPEVKRFLQSHGERPRQRSNRLLFLVPDTAAASRMERTTRQYLGWSSLLDDFQTGRLNLDRLRSTEAEAAKKQALLAMQKSIRETFRWLVVPHQEDPKSSTLTLEKEALNTNSNHILPELERICIEQEWLISRWSPVHLKNLLQQFYWVNEPAIAASRFYEDCQRYLYLPRLASEKVLSDAICSGATSGDYFAIAQEQSGDQFKGFQIASPLIYSSTVLLIEPQHAKDYQEELVREAQQASDKALQKSQTISPDQESSKPQGVIPTSVTESETWQDFPNSTPVHFEFHGSVKIPPHIARSRLNSIAEDIIAILARDPNANVSIKLEIVANYPEGVDENLKKAVEANSRYLEFDIAEWE
ncbi:MAG: ATP-binding protein [Candidatus Cloacimonetes bacterium]|nr:ATP-binding protein [Candidatus Cloacimonadota bacterium]